VIARDPLQAEPSPYELLGVDQKADDEAIKKAFNAALIARHADVGRLRDARTILLRPVDRALVNALLYEPASMSGLSPAWGKDGASLAVGARLRTGESWTAQLRSRFPDLDAIHSLAVLWYWWAIHEGERFTALADALARNGTPAGTETSKQALIAAAVRTDEKACGSPGEGGCSDPSCLWYADCSYVSPDLPDLWERAIAYWAALLASSTFWSSRLGLSSEDQKGACETFENTIKERLSGLRSRFARAGAPGLAGRLAQIDIAFSVELQTARTMVRAGDGLLGPGSSGLGCGKLLLKELGLLERTRERLDEQLQTDSANQRLQDLETNLSPHANIAQLVAKERWDEALTQIEQLPESDRSTAEVTRFKARALIGKGKQQAGAGDLPAALKTWKAALAVAPDDLRSETTDAVVEVCMRKAQALDNRPDDAIAVLEGGLKLIKNRKLELRLGEILSERAVRTFNEVQLRVKSQGDKVLDKDLAEVRKALAALERAAKLGYDQATKHLETAREVIAGLEMMKAIGAGAEWSTAMKAANDAAGRDDWDTTVNHLRTALRLAPPEAQAVIKKNLSISLTNRAVANVNRLAELMTAGRLRDLTAFRATLSSARDDLDEAIRLDPSNSRAREQRGQVDQLLGAMPATDLGFDFGRATRPQPELSMAVVRTAVGGLLCLASIVGACVGIFLSSQDLIGISVVGFIIGVWIGNS
jgi:tetratricopeptide (TPR) repeat protein